ncbi:hypothetical protein SOV_35570 [Sporomusa ovata DSM 2662]|uniref:DUF2793 domain-containing protein n=1 Tax=Sporomusa ovata TaxID=2378 RepID=UPI000388661D|nr:DUF2793 domain-containing protein [Sporomusa ovata]EQB24603.1 hypothetical protein DUF2793 [Sporomusa ovata DSM 2662]EQB24707.1 hypothetical protein SOV_6c01210 [Sporomusa ovata DSM 2662]
MSNTVRLALPNLVSGQAQKEITHNMALQRLDALVQTAVESMILSTPPVGVEGNLYVVGIGATGVWAGKDNSLAHFVGGAWVFYVPFVGMRCWDKATSTAMVYTGNAWVQEDTAQSKIGFFGSTPVPKTLVTLGNVDNEIGSLPISAAYSQIEVQALRDKCEKLADDVRALKAALSSYGLI